MLLFENEYMCAASLNPCMFFTEIQLLHAGYFCYMLHKPYECDAMMFVWWWIWLDDKYWTMLKHAAVSNLLIISMLLLLLFVCCCCCRHAVCSNLKLFRKSTCGCLFLLVEGWWCLICTCCRVLLFCSIWCWWIHELPWKTMWFMLDTVVVCCVSITMKTMLHFWNPISIVQKIYVYMHAVVFDDYMLMMDMLCCCFELS